VFPGASLFRIILNSIVCAHFILSETDGLGKAPHYQLLLAYYHFHRWGLLGIQTIILGVSEWEKSWETLIWGMTSGPLKGYSTTEAI